MIFQRKTSYIFRIQYSYFIACGAFAAEVEQYGHSMLALLIDRNADLSADLENLEKAIKSDFQDEKIMYATMMAARLEADLGL